MTYRLQGKRTFHGTLVPYDLCNWTQWRYIDTTTSALDEANPCAAIIHYQPERDSCSIVKKDQVSRRFLAQLSILAHRPL